MSRFPFYFFLALRAFAQPATQAFEVASIRPTPEDWGKGRFITMRGGEFVARNHTLLTLITAYNLSPKAIAGGPAWVNSASFDIDAKPPGDARPSLDRQMAMLRQLLGDRFALRFHREPKNLAVLALTVARGGPKLREPEKIPDGPAPPLIFVLYPHKATLPGRDATMGELASVLQRAALDRPVLDHTGLTGRFDFDL
ncbi:MAG: TIGR03435 family protein, partial [Acidobacteriota bacterium]|nr:TIGR03435 family protein [Acidobacteriota bacterium]